MNFSPAILLDVALLIVLIATIFHYVHRGFVAGLLDLVGSFGSLAVAWFVSNQVSPTVFDNFFKSGLITKTAETIQAQGGVNVSAIVSKLAGILPKQFVDKIVASTSGVLDSGAPDIADQIVSKVIAPLVVPLITVVLFFATFLICRMLIAFLVATLTNINKIPIVGGANRLLGVVLGAVGGAINVLLILCLIWAIVVITSGKLPILNDEALSGSYVYSTFAKYNPFL